MAAKSNKAAQPDDVLRSVFMAGLQEMKRAGIKALIGNTDKHGGGLVLSVPAWRYCGCCDSVVTVPEHDQAASRCRECAADDVPVLAQRSEVPA